MASEETTSAEPQDTAETPQTGDDKAQDNAPDDKDHQEANQEEANAEPEKQPEKQKRRFFSIYNILGIVLCILILPFFIASVTLLFSSWIDPDSPPSAFGYTPLMVETGSMSPEFEAGDLVLIEKSDEETTYAVGDVICYHSGSAYVTHRIKEITTDEDGNTVYITQGDANNAPDQGSVRADQILGIYRARLEGMGDVFLFIQTPVGMIVGIMLPIILVLLLFLLPPIFAGRQTKSDDKDKTAAHSDGK